MGSPLLGPQVGNSSSLTLAHYLAHVFGLYGAICQIPQCCITTSPDNSTVLQTGKSFQLRCCMYSGSWASWPMGKNTWVKWANAHDCKSGQFIELQTEKNPSSCFRDMHSRSLVKWAIMGEPIYRSNGKMTMMLHIYKPGQCHRV